MKKLLCLCLSLILCLSFCGCDNEKGKENKIDLEYYAKLGKMPEAKFTLGANVDKVINELESIETKENESVVEDHNHEHDFEKEEFFFEVVEGEKSVLLDNGSICYYYNKANKEKGISYIVNYGTAYGFPLGTIITEVENSLSKIEFSEEKLTSENAFFADYVLNGTVLKAEFEKATVLFVFQENELFATAIYNNFWTN